MLTKSGDVVVQAIPSNEVQVRLVATGSEASTVLENAEVDFDAATGKLIVRTMRDQFDSLTGIKSLFKKSGWAGSDLDVTISVPEESSLEVKTASGDTQCHGPLESVELHSASGDIRVIDPVVSLEVKTASGDVMVGQVIESLECRSASGDVHCTSAGVRTEVTTASGDVTVTAERAGEISVKAVSGDVRVNVASGLVIDVNGTTVSGDLGSSIPLDADGEGDGDEETLTIRVSTVSGDFRITRAS
ncbi:MAG TPA: DUF4097 family beta strand repeat-containing protein [Acidimicrobiales bacterium]|nr:DUF4097 family beta strand repeat-containing protein [Acidimicrobiales bacterium]